MKTMLTAAALAAAIAVVPQGAQAQTFSESRMLTSIDDATLTATFKALDATWTTGVRNDGTKTFEVTFPNKVQALFWKAACLEGKGCLGLVMVAPFAAPKGQATAVDAKIRAFNDKFPAGKAYRGVEDNLIVQSYAITDNGITMGNLRTQVKVFTDVCVRFANSIY